MWHSSLSATKMLIASTNVMYITCGTSSADGNSTKCVRCPEATETTQFDCAFIIIIRIVQLIGHMPN